MNYNNFAKTFSNSRKNMKWEEIEYFLNFLTEIATLNKGELKGDFNNFSILDVGCGNGRLLEFLKNTDLKIDYQGVDLSNLLLEEARKIHIGYDFLEYDMLDLHKIDKKFDFIFFIASFHHLNNLEDREKVLNYSKNLLKENGIIFMTNWALNSEINLDKYSNSIIKGSENKFGNFDYNIKIGEFSRFYHCFSIRELDYLFEKSGFSIIENRIFDNNKNIISIIKKN